MEMFLELLQASALSGVGILLILAVSPLLRKKHTVFWRYLLWILLAIRLLLPFDFSLSDYAVHISVSQPFQAESRDWSAAHTKKKPNGLGEAREVWERKTDARSKQAKTVEPDVTMQGTEVWAEKSKSETPMITWAALLWAVGAAVSLAWQLFCYGSFCHKLRRTKVFLTNCKNLPVYRSKAISYPMLFGVGRPQILLPFAEYGKEQLEFILAHEFTHYKRKDLWWKALFAAARTVHWFNPLVYWMERQAIRDMEFLCDNAVVRNFSREEKKQYSQTLLHCAAGSEHGRTVFCVSEFSRDMKTLKERFANIFASENRKKGVLAAGFGIGILLSVSLLVAFSTSSQPSKEGPKEEVQDFADENQSDFDSETRLQERLSKLSGLTVEDVAQVGYGTDMPRLAYASEERAMVYDDWGLLIYDIKRQRIDHLLDVEAAGLWQVSGERERFFEVSEDGRQIFFNCEPGGSEPLIYNIEERRLEYADPDSQAGGRYEGLYEGEDQTYAKTPAGQTAFLSVDSLRTSSGDIFHAEDMLGLSLILADNTRGSAEIYPLFSELYERQGENVFPHLALEDMRRVVGKEFLYEDEEGWSYYLEEDRNGESALDSILEAGGILLLTRYRDGVRQILEDQMLQDTWRNCPVLFVKGRILYQAAATADIMGIKCPALVSIAMDGSDRKVADTIMYDVFDGICEDGGWIYYTGWKNDAAFPRPLCRIAPDFTGGAQFVEDLPGLLCGVMDGYVFYLAAEGRKPGIWRRELATGDERIHDKWGIAAEEIDWFWAREHTFGAGELREEEMPGCHILFHLRDDEQLDTYDVPFYIQ